jgi:two-component system CheB/CheR fusion protein
LTQPNGDAAFDSLIRYIQESRGVDFRGYKRTSLHRRISLRMEHLHVDSFADYHAFLEAHPQEFVDLLNTVLINVTSFFRDPDAWDALKTDALPKLIAPERGLRLGRGTIFSGHAALRAAGTDSVCPARQDLRNRPR